MFTGVNVAVLVLRRTTWTPTVLPIGGAATCAFLATPWADRPAVQYQIAGVLLAIGVVLWLVTVLVVRRSTGTTPRMDPTHFDQEQPRGPRN